MPMWSRTSDWRTLQSQLPRAVLPKQAAVPDVPPHHLQAGMPGLIHDGPLGRTRDRRAGGMTRSE